MTAIADQLRIVLEVAEELERSDDDHIRMYGHRIASLTRAFTNSIVDVESATRGE
jgi:hypothetical protein